jgi:hypothetical protein
VTSIVSTEAGVVIGSAVTLTDMENYLNGIIAKEPMWKTRVFKEVGKFDVIIGLVPFLS